ncbi:MAG: response regulator [Chloroflexi bacterium]|nr:response regulator [Chloroflexota bacterium]
MKPVGGTVAGFSRGEKVSHVLIVDDSEDIRLALRMILEDADYEVKELSDGTEVLSALKTDPPVLVLLDVAMPARNGFDTLKEIIAEEQTRDIPVIMVTAKGRAEDLSRARSLGARDYINKPWEDGEVELRVGWVLKAQDLRAAS